MTRWTETRRGLYAIVDPEYCGTRTPEALAASILDAGCAVLQLRAKTIGDREHLALANRLRRLCRQSGVPFVLNDRPDIAVLVEADGVHLGQDDLPLGAVRRIVGERMAIGISTHGLDQAVRASEEGADYLGFGPVFATSSKSDPDPVVGLDALRQVVKSVSVPVVAIGGITASVAAAVAETGAHYRAAIGALSRAADVAEAARALHGGGP